MVSTSDMPAANSKGKISSDNQRQSLGSLGGGNAQYANLGRGVKTQSEQHAERVHVPTAGDHAEHGAKHAAQQATVGQQQVKVFLDIRLSRTHLHKGPVDRLQHHQVHGRNGKKKEGGNQRADDSADRTNAIHAVLQGQGSPGERDRTQQDNRRVAQRKQEANCNRPLPFLHELAGYVIDGRNVVRIHGMP